MALTFEVEIASDETGGYFQGSAKDVMQARYTANYNVLVSDPADPTFDPRDLGPFDILDAPGLPTVNQTTYQNATNVLPFCVCREKQARREPNRRDLWRVSTSWDTPSETGLLAFIPQQTTIFDYSPYVQETLGDDERTRYQDQNGKATVTPTGNLFSTAFIERVATRLRRVTQYEAVPLLYSTLQNRKFKVNSGTYQGDIAYTWMITQIEFGETLVPTTGGPVTAAQVTYTIAQNPYGWEDVRDLIDTHYLEAANDLATKKRFTDGDDQMTFGDGAINLDGTQYTPIPPYPQSPPLTDFWEMQPLIDFDTFLQA